MSDELVGSHSQQLELWWKDVATGLALLAARQEAQGNVHHMATTGRAKGCDQGCV